MFDPDDDFDPELAELENLSNSVLDLTRAGRLDEAEHDCLELRRRFPREMDWMERTADVAVAKGQNARAIEHYERCMDYIDRNPDGFDPEVKEDFRSLIERLRSEPKDR
ncbi:MAG TPA: hypothetical protein VJ826_06475 [Candidatus Polarisedimenticolaceae bacterium]|nr:hypothetical protein [Candidatus Polarisedimenticolaceae bacterium]